MKAQTRNRSLRLTRSDTRLQRRETIVTPRSAAIARLNVGFISAIEQDDLVTVSKAREAERCQDRLRLRPQSRSDAA